MCRDKFSTFLQRPSRQNNTKAGAILEDPNDLIGQKLLNNLSTNTVGRDVAVEKENGDVRRAGVGG
jgi:hypothetical protein